MVPGDMAAAAEQHGLGVLRGWVANRPKRRPWLTFALLGVAGTGAAVAGVAITCQNGRQNGGWYGGLCVFIGPVFVLWVATRLRSAPGPTNSWVAWYERGIVHRVGQAEPRAYPWEAVRSVTRHDVRIVKRLRTYVRHNLLIVPREGDLISVDDSFDCAHPFSEQLTAAFARARAPREIIRLQAGERLHYGGQLAVDEAGVSTRDRRLGWRDLDRIALGPGGVMNVYRRGQGMAYLSVSAAVMPNLLVFLTLAEEMRRRAAT